jgi:hypothetical protein
VESTFWIYKYVKSTRNLRGCKTHLDVLVPLRQTWNYTAKISLSFCNDIPRVGSRINSIYVIYAPGQKHNPNILYFK